MCQPHASATRATFSFHKYPQINRPTKHIDLSPSWYSTQCSYSREFGLVHGMEHMSNQSYITYIASMCHKHRNAKMRLSAVVVWRMSRWWWPFWRCLDWFYDMVELCAVPLTPQVLHHQHHYHIWELSHIFLAFIYVWVRLSLMKNVKLSRI